LPTLHFYKYQGTGNDFILVDDRQNDLALTQAQIAQICHRRFGIGADGFILLRSHPRYDFEMIYYNSDGRTSSMCGNGGRCIARFAADVGLTGNPLNFLAIDGSHQAKLESQAVALQMRKALPVKPQGTDWFVDTGSPHHVVFNPDPDSLEILSAARAIRYSSLYKEGGVNVNFVAVTENNILKMRTYERGVEAETYSCGTGVTAAALAAFEAKRIMDTKAVVQTKGGQLTVTFEPYAQGYRNIWLTGPAQFVFKGVYYYD
jgi:diaminopimelate epimerase